MHVVVAPDSFKGTATTQQAGQWLSRGITEVLPRASLHTIAMADGGEGTASCFSGEVITLPTVTAAGRLTEASYIWDATQATAYIDVAAASGLPAVTHHPVPLTGDTYGTGVLIADAQTRGATRIVLALGGSATIDGGTGVLVALGATPVNAKGYAVPKGGGHLTDIADIDTAHLNIPAAGVEWVLLTDVTAPATGATGAAAVFGPQKGATKADIARLDAGLTHLCRLLHRDATTPGFGAAGGVPIAVTWLSEQIWGTPEHVRLLPGAAVVAAAGGVSEALDTADLLITGEGRLDGQSFTGKVVGTLLELAEKKGVPVGIATGSLTNGLPLPRTTLVEILDSEVGVEEQLVRAGRRLARSYLTMSTAQG